MFIGAPGLSENVQLMAKTEDSVQFFRMSVHREQVTMNLLHFHVFISYCRNRTVCMRSLDSPPLTQPELELLMEKLDSVLCTGKLPSPSFTC